MAVTHHKQINIFVRVLFTPKHFHFSSVDVSKAIIKKLLLPYTQRHNSSYGKLKLRNSRDEYLLNEYSCLL